MILVIFVLHAAYPRCCIAKWKPGVEALFKPSPPPDPRVQGTVE